MLADALNVQEIVEAILAGRAKANPRQCIPS
jgi:hypothetical protein